MASHFEIIAHDQTPLGDLVLRRRLPPGNDQDWIYEILLSGDFLMSSLVRTSEEALSELTLAAHSGEKLDVVVGGLGLGYTASAALRNPRVQSLLVVELLPSVISWHQNDKLPLGRTLAHDPRCSLQIGDFFEWIQSTESSHDLILVDIDHSPDSLLAIDHSTFYQPETIRTLHSRLRPSGIFGLWSATPPGTAYLDTLQEIFEEVRTHPIAFHNPHIDMDDNNTVLIARKA